VNSINIFTRGVKRVLWSAVGMQGIRVKLSDFWLKSSAGFQPACFLYLIIFLCRLEACATDISSCVSEFQIKKEF